MVIVLFKPYLLYLFVPLSKIKSSGRRTEIDKIHLKKIGLKTCLADSFLKLLMWKNVKLIYLQVLNKTHVIFYCKNFNCILFLFLLKNTYFDLHS